MLCNADSEKGCLNVDYAFFSTQERHQATFSTSKPYFWHEHRRANAIIISGFMMVSRAW